MQTAAFSPATKEVDEKVLKAIKNASGIAPQYLRRLAPGRMQGALDACLERLLDAGEIYRSTYAGTTRYYAKAQGRATLEARRANANAIERESRERLGVTPARTFTTATPGRGTLSLAGFMEAPRAGSDTAGR